MKEQNKCAIVVGAGIMGLAFALSLHKKGYQVTVFEQGLKASGSSIRNFGMVWPIGQPAGTLLNRALKSRTIWKEVCEAAGIWYNETGSVQILSNELELQLAEEFCSRENRDGLRILNKEKTLNMVPFANSQNTMGGLFSETEVIVESRDAIRLLPEYFSTLGIHFHFGTAVTEVKTGKVKTAFGKSYEADVVVICNGYELGLLYPEYFASAPVTISSLNMMRSAPITEHSPAICAGLSFLHYKSYDRLPSLEAYENWVINNYPLQHKHGIHLLVSQNPTGKLTIGDSHHYGLHHEPFQVDLVDQLILDYMQDVLDLEQLRISERWMGQYLKLTNGGSELVYSPEPGVWIANGPGGAGMTLSFGMAEEVVAETILA